MIIETAYWKNTLRTFFIDGTRINIPRVVEFYSTDQPHQSLSGQTPASVFHQAA